MDSRKILYIDMDGVLVDFNSGVAKLDESLKLTYRDHYDHVPGIFATMDPIPGGIAAYKWLMKHFNVYFLSKPCHKNSSCYSDKRDWIARYIGEYHTDRLILTPAKHLNKGHYLIDDRPVPLFEGKQILFGSEEFKDWSDVLKFFELEIAKKTTQ